MRTYKGWKMDTSCPALIVYKKDKYEIIKFNSRDYSTYELDEDGQWQYIMTWYTLRDAMMSL